MRRTRVTWTVNRRVLQTEMDDSREAPSCCGKSRCRLPERARPYPPLPYHRNELRECFPCYFEGSFLLDKFPFLKWLLRYKPSWLVSDVIAGLTVGLMVVPQALAYASIARLPPQYGLYSAFMGCFVYAVFGTSKDVTLGPTAILSLLTASLTASCGPDHDQYAQRITCAVALTFLSGAIQLALGLLNLGFLVDFIPVPVISGFTSAAAITIASGQLKSLLGIQHVRRPFIDSLIDIVKQIKQTKVGDVVLGLLCILLVVFLKLFKTHNEQLEKKRAGQLHWVQRVTFKFLWFVCTARNAVVVLVAGLVGYTLSVQPWFSDQVTLIQYNHSAVPPLVAPNPSGAICKELGIGIVVAPLISFLESIAIAKAFSRKGGYKVDPSQELVAIGMCNIASSFVGSYPVTGSFSRTAVNAQSGVRTPAAGIVTGCVVLLALAVLGPLFHYIPSASLAAIIIVAVLPVVDLRIIWRILTLNFVDVFPLAISFLLTLLLGIEYGVPVAVVVYVLFLLYRHSRPRHEMKLYGSVVCVVFNGGWTYPGLDYMINRVTNEITRDDLHPERRRTKALILDCTAMPEIDFAIVQAMSELCEELEGEGIQVVAVNSQVSMFPRPVPLSPRAHNTPTEPQVLKILEKAKISNLQFYPSMESALQMTSGVESSTAGSEPINRGGSEETHQKVVGILEKLRRMNK